MEKEPLISVIIPVYNGEKYIRPCIENILNQSYKNLEIIVVNDGSSEWRCYQSFRN
ncbi:MAG: glycosyltransferase family A protein [Proteiniphilum sp.]|nr:glycosyltransferase family A protein [Proteiniphilum sp.]MDY9918410.1 glycosyltransferase family A protein [Proteiniphilum sp.]